MRQQHHYRLTVWTCLVEQVIYGPGKPSWYKAAAVFPSLRCIDLIPLITNYVRLQAYSVGNAEELRNFVNALEKNLVQTVIDSVFPIEKVQDAFHRFKSGKAFGKVVITF